MKAAAMPTASAHYPLRRIMREDRASNTFQEFFQTLECGHTARYFGQVKLYANPHGGWERVCRKCPKEMGGADDAE